MTARIIELKQAPVVLVGLPDGAHCQMKTAYEPSIFNDNQPYVSYFMPIIETHRAYLPIGTYKVVGILSDLTEDQFAEWAVKYPGNATPQRYVNHAHKEKSTGMQVARVSFLSTHMASDSCFSLLESEKVYTENPVKVHTYASENSGHYLKQRQEAQSRTIDPERTVVLIRKE